MRVCRCGSAIHSAIQAALALTHYDLQRNQSQSSWHATEACGQHHQHGDAHHWWLQVAVAQGHQPRNGRPRSDGHEAKVVALFL